MRVLLLPLLFALSGWAQTAEIRGTVVEQGPNTPLPGAEVTLYEFVPNGDTLDAKVFKSIHTDSRGAFSFKPGHLGDFRLEVKKPGYVVQEDGPRNPGGDTFTLQLFLAAARPTAEHRIVLMNPSSLTGRIVDEDRKPVADFRVFVQPADSLLIFGRGTPAVTDADGTFTVTKLPPGPSVVRTSVEGMQALSIIDYGEAEAKIVDEAIETAYWPGGVADPKAALPIPVPPGTPANIGTIVLRKGHYHRASVELTGDCTAEEWTYALLKLPRDPRVVEQRSVTGPCRKQFILRNLAPGSYALAVSVGKKESLRWAHALITIANENVQARLIVSPVTDLTIRFMTADGGPLPRFPPVRAFRPEDLAIQQPSAPPTLVRLRVEDAPTIGDFGGAPDAEGRLVVPSLPWAHYSVSVPGVPSSHSIKEMRYNRQPFTDGLITLVPGGLLEIVLSDRPASIAGIVKDGSLPSHGVVILNRWPPVRPGNYEGNEPFSYIVQAVDDGTFQISGLAPGDYRIRAVTTTLTETSPEDGDKVTLATRDHKTIELKLK